MGYVLGLAGDMCAAARDDDVTQFKTCTVLQDGQFAALEKSHYNWKF